MLGRISLSGKAAGYPLKGTRRFAIPLDFSILRVYDGVRWRFPRTSTIATRSGLPARPLSFIL